MKATRRALVVAAGAAALIAGSGTAAFAQSSIRRTITPVRTDGGWIYWLAFLSLGLAVLLLIFLIALYMRFAPRFSKDEDQSKVVRADRVLPGREAPRRLVDVSQAVPVVAQPPAAVAAAPAVAPAAAPAAPAAAAPAAAEAPAERAAPAAAAEASVAATAAPPAPGGGRPGRGGAPRRARGAGRSGGSLGCGYSGAARPRPRGTRARTAGRATRGLLGPRGVRADAQGAARRGHRPSDRGRQGQAHGDDRRAQEGRRLGAARWPLTRPSSSTGRSVPTRPGSPTGTPRSGPRGRSRDPAQRSRMRSAR